MSVVPLVLWLVSRTIGLPIGPETWTPEAVGLADVGCCLLELVTLALASVGGVTALLSHLAKASLRLAINTSPEPVTNIGASLAGDVSVAGVASLAVLFPVAAAIIAAILLIIGIVVAWFALSRIRRGWRAFRRWMSRQQEPNPVQ